MDTLVYALDGNLYINLTNQCSNRCTFCVRNGHTDYRGYPLWLARTHTAQQYIEAIGDPRRFNQVVFCGFGEPTYRLDALSQIAAYVKQAGGTTRLNTNGQGNRIAGHDIYDRLTDIDIINVSLNEVTAEDYDSLCRPQFDHAWQSVQDFAQGCLAHGLRVQYSIVDVIGSEKVARTQALADGQGIPLYVRQYIPQ